MTLLKAQPVKTEGGTKYPASDYAYVPDSKSPSTWKLRLTSSPGGEPDAKIVGAAIAALGVGFRGQKVKIPSKDLPKVKAKVRAAWIKANPDKDPADMPRVIAKVDDTDNLLKVVPSAIDEYDELEEVEPAPESDGEEETDVARLVKAYIDPAEGAKTFAEILQIGRASCRERV